MHGSTPRRLATVACAAGASLLALAALAPSAQADHPAADDLTGNPTCESLGFDFELRLEGWPAEPGTPTEGDHTLEEPTENEFKAADDSEAPAGLTVNIDDVEVDDDAKTVTFDWAISADEDEIVVDALLVKVGNGGLRYDYEPAASEHDGVVSDKDSVSHLSFCWGELQEPEEPEVEETTTTTVTPTTASQGPSATAQDPSEVGGELFTNPAGSVDTLPRTGTSSTLALSGVALLLIGGNTLLGRRLALLRA